MGLVAAIGVSRHGDSFDGGILALLPAAAFALAVLTGGVVAVAYIVSVR